MMMEELLKEMLTEENLDRERFKLTDEDLAPLKDWVNSGWLPGDFLQAVLRNDLAEAAGRADLRNRRRLFEYVQWLYNEAPSNCWGSPEKVENWVREFTE